SELAHRAVPRRSRSPEPRRVTVAVGRPVRPAGEIRRRGAGVRRIARGPARLVLIPTEPLVGLAVGALLAVAGLLPGVVLGRVPGAEDLRQLRIEVTELLGILGGAAVGEGGGIVEILTRGHEIQLRPQP